MTDDAQQPEYQCSWCTRNLYNGDRSCPLGFKSENNDRLEGMNQVIKKCGCGSFKDSRPHTPAQEESELIELRQAKKYWMCRAKKSDEKCKEAARTATLATLKELEEWQSINIEVYGVEKDIRVVDADRLLKKIQSLRQAGEQE